MTEIDDQELIECLSEFDKNVKYTFSLSPITFVRSFSVKRKHNEATREDQNKRRKQGTYEIEITTRVAVKENCNSFQILGNMDNLFI